MATSLESLRKNPHTGELLDAIREWEICRLAKTFSTEIKEQLKDPKTEFHLEKISDTTWNLVPLVRDETHSPAMYKRGDPVRIRVRKN